MQGNLAVLSESVPDRALVRRCAVCKLGNGRLCNLVQSCAPETFEAACLSFKHLIVSCSTLAAVPAILVQDLISESSQPLLFPVQELSYRNTRWVEVFFCS